MPDRRVLRGELSAADLMVVLGLAAISALGWMALLAMDNHIGTPTVIGMLAVACLLVMIAIALAGGRLPRLRLDLPGLLVLLAVAGFAAFMFFPGFDYGATDKDPGSYMAIGAAFARYHSYSFPDVLLARYPGIVTQSLGARFPAVWVHSPGTIVPQFYHLWPSLLAVAHDVHGLGAEAQTTPLVGVLSVMTFTGLVRRLVGGRAGLFAAATAGGWLAANSAEVWQAKYPTVETLEQALLMGVLFCIVVALQTGWAPVAGLGGVLLGVDWLARADTLLPVAILVVVGGALIALRRFDRRCAWFTAGFVLTLPHVLWQAYGALIGYTREVGIPPLWLVGAGTAAALVVALALRYGARPAMSAITGALLDRRAQRRIGAAVAVLAGLALVGGGLDTALSASVNASTSTQTMRWVGWLAGWPLVVIAFFGLLVVALRPWRSHRWAAAVPALVMTPVFLVNLHDELPLMPGVRRLLPAVIPGLILLAVIALGAAFGLRRFWRVLAVVAAVGIWASYLPQSLPLRAHNEDGGSFAVVSQLAATSPNTTGIYLWQFPRAACCTSPEYLFGGAVWLDLGDYSALLPTDDAKVAGYVNGIHSVLPHHPVFVVWAGGQRPPVTGLSLTRVREIVGHLQIWDESYRRRPTGESPGVPVDFTVWRVREPG